jgi:hypothetical protein
MNPWRVGPCQKPLTKNPSPSSGPWIATERTKTPSPSRAELGAGKGPPKKQKSVTPVVGGVGVRGQKRTRSDLFSRYFFYRDIELPSPRNAQNRDKKKSRKSRFGTSGRNFCKSFSTRFFLQNVFCSVFKLPSLKNTRECDRTKKSRGKVDIVIFVETLGKVFGTDFLPKYFMVFLNSPCRETPKNLLKKK